MCEKGLKRNKGAPLELVEIRGVDGEVNCGQERKVSCNHEIKASPWKGKLLQVALAIFENQGANRLFCAGLYFVL